MSTRRGDVDGLRALAVVAVVLFHLDAPFASGGFLGVDVFLVVSGYLISQQVGDAVRRGGPFLGAFLVRRVRRLLPALLVVVLATLVAVAVLLPPTRFLQLRLPAFAAATSWANFQQLELSGYWGVAAERRPLLHTWSLSLEEQFYLVWPPLLLLLGRSRRGAARAVVLLGLASFVLAWLAHPLAPDEVFYLLPFRLWEFAVGAAVALGGLPRPRPGLRRPLAVGGLLLVVGSLVLVGDGPTPPLVQLLPVLGTALLLDAEVQHPVWDAAPVAWLGRASYSLYLVHWPVVVLLRELTGELTAPTVALAVLLTLALGAGLHHGVEQPLRLTGALARQRSWRPAVPVLAGVLGVVLAVQVGALVQVERAGPLAALATGEEPGGSRTAEPAAACTPAGALPCGAFAPDAPDVVVLGDSLATDAFHMVRAALPDATVHLLQQDGCRPFVAAPEGEVTTPGCRATNDARFAEVARWRDEVDAVLLATAVDDATRIAGVATTVRWLAAQDVPTLVLGVGPSFQQPARDVVADGDDLARVDAVLAAALSSDLAALEQLDDDLAAAVGAAGGVHVPRLAASCDAAAGCRALTPDGTLFHLDNVHLTRDGAREVGTMIAPALRRGVPAAGLAAG